MNGVFARFVDLLFPVSCDGCGRSGVALCWRCLPAEPRHTTAGPLAITALGRYEGRLREGVLHMKAGERAYLATFAEALAQYAERDTTLVGVPTSPRRARIRGFDQGPELARRIAAREELPYAAVLRRRGGPQHGLMRAARLANARFVVVADEVLPRSVTLVDDVCTTGATLEAAAAALVAYGVRVRGALVVARAETVASEAVSKAVPVRRKEHS
jgi:predicted amidophosphoribosyltransferase